MSTARCPLAILAALIVAGCGGSGAKAQHTTTISAAQAAKQGQAAQSWQVGQPVPKAPAGPVVIECGEGLSTNGACVFALNVARAYRSNIRNGVPLSELVVTGNPVSCAKRGNGWRCHSLRSGVWVASR